MQASGSAAARGYWTRSWRDNTSDVFRVFLVSFLFLLLSLRLSSERVCRALDLLWSFSPLAAAVCAPSRSPIHVSRPPCFGRQAGRVNNDRRRAFRRAGRTRGQGDCWQTRTTLRSFSGVFAQHSSGRAALTALHWSSWSRSHAQQARRRRCCN